MFWAERPVNSPQLHDHPKKACDRRKGRPTRLTGPFSLTSDLGRRDGTDAHRSGGRRGSVDARRRMRKRRSDRTRNTDRRCSRDRRRHTAGSPLGNANARDAANSRHGCIGGSARALRLSSSPAERRDYRLAQQKPDPPAVPRQAAARRMPAIWTVSSFGCSIRLGDATTVIRENERIFDGPGSAFQSAFIFVFKRRIERF
jgi:hypothetical protein